MKVVNIKNRNNSMSSIEPPSPALVEDAKRQWHENKRFVVQDKALRRLYYKLCPRHDDIAEVLLKVTVLNSFYSTNLYYPFEVAKRIVALKPCERIADGDTSLVNEMALVSVRGKEHRFYSFATKYCCQHNPDNFPIFDTLVETMLLHFRSVDGFAEFKKKDLKDYPRFFGIVQAFREFYGLGKFSLRWIDRYLWFAGRAAFGKGRLDYPRGSAAPRP
jgi:hypothetical protein